MRSAAVFAAAVVVVVLAVVASAATAERLRNLRDLDNRARPASGGQPAVSAPRAPHSALPFTTLANITVHPADAERFAVGGAGITTKLLDVPPRYMWGWGPGLSGYCGETSFQSALLLYGAWVSAERVCYADGDAELLISVNDDTAAKNLHLVYEVYEDFKSTAQEFLNGYLKAQIDRGAPVVLGFYELMKGGDSDYDHIMVVIGYDFDGTNVVGIYHNDFFSQQTRYLGKTIKATGASNPHFITTRSKCQLSSAPSQPYDYCIPSGRQYAIALQGLNVPLNGIYTSVAVNSWKEPDWGREDKLHQAPVLQKYSLTVKGLTAGAAYTILRFDAAAALTNGKDPRTASYTWTQDFTATAATQSFPDISSLMSDGEYYWITVTQ